MCVCVCVCVCARARAKIRMSFVSITALSRTAANMTHNCYDVMNIIPCSGSYKLNAPEVNSLTVFCDMESDPGGWLVCILIRKEMFYLTTQTTHFIHGYMAPDTCYGTTQIAREETRWQQGFFYMHHPTDRMAHTTAFISPVAGWNEK